jgi:hypothetical protein
MRSHFVSTRPSECASGPRFPTWRSPQFQTGGPSSCGLGEGRRKSQDDPAGYVSTMADQPLNAAKVETLYIDLGGATMYLVPEVIGPNFTSSVNTSQNSPG